MRPPTLPLIRGLAGCRELNNKGLEGPFPDLANLPQRIESLALAGNLLTGAGWAGAGAALMCQAFPWMEGREGGQQGLQWWWWAS